MLIVRHLGTPNSDFNGCDCMRDPVLYRSMGQTPLGCKHSLLPTSLPDILKPIGHRGYNKYSKGSKNALSGIE